MKQAELPPVFLEHPLRWEQLEENSQKLFLEGLQTQNFQAWIDSLEPVMDCVFLVTFPASIVNPQAPPEAQGRIGLFAKEKRSSNPVVTP